MPIGVPHSTRRDLPPCQFLSHSDDLCKWPLSVLWPRRLGRPRWGARGPSRRRPARSFAAAVRRRRPRRPSGGAREARRSRDSGAGCRGGRGRGGGAMAVAFGWFCGRKRQKTRKSQKILFDPTRSARGRRKRCLSLQRRGFRRRRDNRWEARDLLRRFDLRYVQYERQGDTGARFSELQWHFFGRNYDRTAGTGTLSPKLPHSRGRSDNPRTSHVREKRFDPSERAVEQYLALRDHFCGRM